MALTFPLSLANFWDLGPVSETTLWLPQTAEGEETGAGEIYQVQSSPRLWEGSASFASDVHDEIDQLMARANLVLAGGASFLLTPRHRRFPRGATSASQWAGSYTLTAVAANQRDITIAGLSANQQLQVGSYLSFTYAGRRAFHQVMATGVAGAGGSVTLEVTPAIRPGWAEGAVVALTNPVLRAIIKGGTLRPARNLPGYSAGLAFDWRQTLRD